MPTPSPIIETRIGVTVLMSVMPARMNSTRNAVATAVIARAMGIIVAEKVLKTMRRTMIAASRPSVSDVPCSTGGDPALAVYPDGASCGSYGVAPGVLDGDHGIAVAVVDDLIELRLRVGDSAVVRERVLLEGIFDAVQARLV